MKKLLSIISMCFLYGSIQAQYNFNFTGDFIDNFNIGGQFTLVPQSAGRCGQLVSGAAWNTINVDFTRDFIIDYDAKINPYDNQTVPSGADGHVVVFGSNVTPTSVNVGGGAMGYYNVPGQPTNPDFDQSIGIEFDLYPNFNFGDPIGPGFYDHITISANGDHTQQLPNLLASPAHQFDAVPIDNNNSNSIVPNTYMRYTIEWDCEEEVLRVYYSTVLKIEVHIDPSLAFLNPSSVPWGIVAGRGGDCTEFYFKNTILQYDDNCGDCADAAINMFMEGCRNGTIQNAGPYFPMGFYGSVNNLPLSMTVNQFVWDMGDGTVFVENNPLQTPAAHIHNYYTFGPKTVTLTVYATGENYLTCTTRVTAHIHLPDCNVPGQDEPGDDGGGFGNGKPGRKNTTTSIGKNASSTNIANDSKVRIYPNPASEQIFVELFDNKMTNITIFDVTGKTVFSQNINESHNSKIDIHNLSNGMYSIRVTDSQGNPHFSKVVVQK